jgi:hypothetical protein
MKVPSSLTSCRLLILSRLLSSLIWAQLTLLVPALGIRSPPPQHGAPIHRVRAHSLTGVRNTYDPSSSVSTAMTVACYLSIVCQGNTGHRGVAILYYRNLTVTTNFVQLLCWHFWKPAPSTSTRNIGPTPKDLQVSLALDLVSGNKMEKKLDEFTAL